MRISTGQIHQQGLRAIVEHQVELARTQQQLASGRRILSPSDDPVAGARLLELREQIATTEQYQRNIGLANGRLGIEDNALQGAGEVLQRARELTLQANNAPLNAADRRDIAHEVRQLLGQLQDLANTQDGNGEYLFAGFRTRSEPFVPEPAGGVRYQGDQGQRMLQVGVSRQVAVGDSGDEVFQRIRNGNGSFSVSADAANAGSGTIAVGSVVDPSAVQPHLYRIQFTAPDRFDVIDETSSTTLLSNQAYRDGEAIGIVGMQTAIDGEPAAGDRFTIRPAANQDLFATLGNLVAALEAPGDTPAQRSQQNQSLGNVLADLDQGLEHLSGVRSRVGARLAALESQEQANQDFSLRMEQIVAEVDGLDYAEAATRLNAERLALEAAQQSFVRIQNLSLFNYLG